MKKITKISLIIGIIVVFAIVYYLYPKELDKSAELTSVRVDEEKTKNVEVVENEDSDIKSSVTNDRKQETTEITENTKETKPQTAQKEEPLPTSKKLEVPFIPQAPFQDWSEPWQNACEEAALLTLHYYIQGDKNVYKEKIKQEILDMLDWQMKYFDSHKDLKMEEVAEMAEEYLGYKNVKVVNNIDIENIKAEIAKNNPVLIPAAGRVLNNPNFTPPGPIYHNLVVIGYTENKIITNDPGTRNGANFEYTYNNFYDSVHDYIDGAEKNNPEKMLEGRKAMIIINN